MKPRTFEATLKIQLINDYMVITALEIQRRVCAGSLIQEPKISEHLIGQVCLKLFSETISSENLAVKVESKKREEKLLKISEAARALKVSPQTLRNLISRKNISIYKTPGGHRRINLDDFRTK